MSSSASGSSTSQTPRHTRSNVWEHYEPNVVSVDGNLKAVCKYCSIQLNSKSDTSSLKSHIANACLAIAPHIRQKFQATLNKQPLAEIPFAFDPQLCREEMIKYIIHAEIPFLKFEDPYLEPWLKTLQPTFKVMGRQTIHDGCWNKYVEMKKELQAELQSLDSRVCLTSDIWTSSQNLGYMAVTAHYIDAEFEMKKKIIWFKKLKYPHSGFAIEEELLLCLAEWGIRDKIFTLTVDNAANNTAACELLVTDCKHDLMLGGEHVHVRCCAHILNILVQDGMSVIHSAIHKIRELIRHIDSSPSRLQVFNSIANGKGLPSKSGVYLDIPTRWNSTYKMIREVKEYKAVLNTYASKYLQNSPTDEEWMRAEAICEFLRAFEELTLAVSAHRKPTAYMFLPLVLCIMHALKEDSSLQTTNSLKELAVSMSFKFEKYWEPNKGNPRSKDKPLRKKKEIAFNVALVIATILDPRRKALYLDFFFKRVCKNADHIGMSVNSALLWMRKYFMEYMQRDQRASSIDIGTHASDVSIIGSRALGKRKLEAELAEFEQYKSQVRDARSQKSEIDVYLEEAAESETKGFDVLTWWKNRAAKFPILSAMARDFLAIPLSTVSSESAFSYGGMILDDYRSSLTPEMLEALVCTKDWLFKVENPELCEKSDDEEVLMHCEEATKYDGNLIGSRIKVWWPGDKMFYNGLVESFDPGSKRHRVAYDDGDVEVLLLSDEKWDFISEDKGVSVASKTPQGIKRKGDAVKDKNTETPTAYFGSVGASCPAQQIPQTGSWRPDPRDVERPPGGKVTDRPDAPGCCGLPNNGGDWTRGRIPCGGHIRGKLEDPPGFFCSQMSPKSNAVDPPKKRGHSKGVRSSQTMRLQQRQGFQR